jgi:hypothetical protein
MKKKPIRRKMISKNKEVAINGETSVYAPLSPEDLIAQAIAKGTPVETMERLLEMWKKMKESKAKEEFDRAMANFQKSCPTIEKTKQGYNYKYADLTNIIEQVKELLADNG